MAQRRKGVEQVEGSGIENIYGERQWRAHGIEEARWRTYGRGAGKLYTWRGSVGKILDTMAKRRGVGWGGERMARRWIRIKERKQEKRNIKQQQ